MAYVCDKGGNVWKLNYSRSPIINYPKQKVNFCQKVNWGGTGWYQDTVRLSWVVKKDGYAKYKSESPHFLILVSPIKKTWQRQETCTRVSCFGSRLSYHSFFPEVDADCGDELGVELVICVAVQECCLPHTRVSQGKELYQVVIIPISHSDDDQ